MKKLLLLVFIIAFQSNAFSQGKVGPITFTNGVEIDEDKEKIIRIAGEVNSRIYTLATRGKNYFVKVFDSEEMELKATHKIDLDEYNGKDIDFEDFVIIKGRPIILGSVYDRKEKENNVIAFVVSEEGTVTKDRKILINTKVKKKKERGGFYFKTDPSEERLLILHAAISLKDEVIKYEMKLVDENLTELANSKEVVPFEKKINKEFNITDFAVSEYGDVFITINESYRDRKAKENIEKFEVHAFKQSNSYQKEIIKIDFTDKEVVNCEILPTLDGKLHLVGFYSSVRKSGRPNKKLKGVYVGVVDIASNEVSSLKFNEFDLETKTKLIGERRAKKGKDVKPLYAMHSLVEKEDGGLIMLSEYQLVIVGRSSGIGPLAITPIQYVNNEIIVTSIAPDGSVAWSNVIPKQQKAAFSVISLGIFGFSGNGNFTVGGGIQIPLGVLGKGPEYLSAVPIYEDGVLSVIFNDSKKNAGVTDIEEIKNMGNYNKSVPTIFVFDDNGNIERIDQTEYEDGQLIMRPRVYYRTNPNEYIIYSSLRSKDKLGRMYIE